MIASKRMTAEEFEKVAGQLGPCELVRGEVVNLSPGGMNHSAYSNNVAYLLTNWVRQSGLGRVWINEAGIVVERDPDTVRGADVAYISYQRLPKGSRSSSFSRVPPEIVVEIVGKGQGWADMVEKAGEYLRMGVLRVWVLDPSGESLHVFRGDAEPLMLSDAELVEDADILPGFSCRVSEFFEV